MITLKIDNYSHPELIALNDALTFALLHLSRTQPYCLRPIKDLTSSVEFMIGKIEAVEKLDKERLFKYIESQIQSTESETGDTKGLEIEISRGIPFPKQAKQSTEQG